MQRSAAFVVALSLLSVTTAAGAAESASLRVQRVSGEPVAAQRLVAISGDDVVLATATGEVKTPLTDVIEIGFGVAPDLPRAWAAGDAAVDLASGETLFGEIKTGDEHGFTLASPLLGNVHVPLDRVLAVRFLQRLAQMPEPPDLHAAETTDVVHLVGGDRMACTIESFSDKAVTVEGSSGQKGAVAYPRITALRVTGDAAKKPAGTLLVVVLRDGSQVIGSSPAAKDGRLRMKSLSGFEADAGLADIVAAHVLSDRFAFLSDLPAAKTEVQPFWKPVAGDAILLYAPRTDRSFTGRTLRSGGRTWVKGLGVYSGTSMTWALDGKFSEFRTSAGLDDGAGPLGGVVFEVVVDGQTKWTSGFLRAAGVEGRGKPSPIDAPRIDVKGAKTLTLRVLSGDAEDPWPIADEADWLGAMLVR